MQHKLIYTVGNFYDAGQQVMVYDHNAANIPHTVIQKKIARTFPEATTVLNNLYAPQQEEVVPPLQGDVIWTETSGRKWIGHMLIHKNDETALNEEAVRLCIRSVRKKAVELGQDSVSMPLICAQDNKMQWLRVYPIIEEEMQGIKTIVWVPDKEYLADVMTLVPGEWNAFSRTPFIRFK